MSNNTIPPAANWEEFRGRLFELIENRRPIAATFEHADIYFFITRCRNAFIAPNSDKGQEALDLIAQNGSFRLVAGTWSEFLALFSVEPPADVIDQSNQSRQSGEVDTRVTRQHKGPKEQDSQYNSQRTHRAVDHGEKPARSGSGQPF